MNNDENVHEDGAGAPEGAAGLRLASKVLCSRAIDELEECESWPTPPDFDKLMRLLDKSMEVTRVREGIERELAWCERLLNAGTNSCEELSDKAMQVCAAYRRQMVEYATKMLAPGEAFDEGVVAKPCFQLEPLSNASADVLRELLGEVRTAYAKFCRVLSDNGPFSLHPTSYLDEDVKLAGRSTTCTRQTLSPTTGRSTTTRWITWTPSGRASSSSAARARTRRP